MWDVIWTDPDRELVGEHRAKKGRSQEDKEKHGLQSGRNSTATSHSSSSSESPFGFFRSKASKRADTPKNSNSGRPPSLSGLASPSLLSSLSPFSQTFDGISRRSSGIITTAPTSPNKDTVEEGRYSTEQTDNHAAHISLSSSRSGAEAHFHAAEQHPHGTQSSKLANDKTCRRIDETTRLMQLLGEAANNIELPDILDALSKGKSLEGKANVSTASSASPQRGNTHKLDSPESPVTLVPPPKSPLRPAATTLGFNNPSAWRKPDHWAHEQSPEDSLDAVVAIPFQALSVASPDVSTIDLNEKHEVLAMACTSPSTILSRLDGLAEDAVNLSVKMNAEYEKKQWMLSVLQHLDSRTPRSCGSVCSGPQSSCKQQAMLVLYEPQVTAKYFGALFEGTHIYHFTPDRLDHDKHANVQSLQVSLSAADPFPTPPEMFETVFSITVPSLCRYNDLPLLLSNIRSSLKENGSFKVTIIDPLPCAESLGEKMRAWLELNLLQNLEQNSRCVEPSRLFPKLLGDAGLRGKGSRRTKVKFYALRESAIGLEYHDPDPFIERLRVEKEAKAELRSAVGRMLWLEVWGKYITSPTTWWWDDRDCLEECLRLGTFWEYHVIEAVRSD